MFFVLIHDYTLFFTGSPCCKFSYYNYISIWPYMHTTYWLIFMFSQLCLHTLMSLVFCYVLKRVVLMGLLLIAAGICFDFILLANQEMLCWKANQKRWHLQVVDIPDWPYSVLYNCCWLVSFNRLVSHTLYSECLVLTLVWHVCLPISNISNNCD